MCMNVCAMRSVRLHVMISSRSHRFLQHNSSNRVLQEHSMPNSPQGSPYIRLGSLYFEQVVVEHKQVVAVVVDSNHQKAELDNKPVVVEEVLVGSILVGSLCWLCCGENECI